MLHEQGVYVTLELGAERKMARVHKLVRDESDEKIKIWAEKYCGCLVLLWR